MIVIRVRSLSQARTFLEDRGMVDESSKESVRLKLLSVQGLDIRLVESWRRKGVRHHRDPAGVRVGPDESQATSSGSLWKRHGRGEIRSTFPIAFG
jgi:hypothetical protein